MYILGIDAVFHDSAARILKGGKLLAAAEEECFADMINAPSSFQHESSFLRD